MSCRSWPRDIVQGAPARNRAGAVPAHPEDRRIADPARGRRAKGVKCGALRLCQRGLGNASAPAQCPLIPRPAAGRTTDRAPLDPRGTHAAAIRRAPLHSASATARRRARSAATWVCTAACLSLRSIAWSPRIAKARTVRNACMCERHCASGDPRSPPPRGGCVFWQGSARFDVKISAYYSKFYTRSNFSIPIVTLSTNL